MRQISSTLDKAQTWADVSAIGDDDVETRHSDAKLQTESTASNIHSSLSKARTLGRITAACNSKEAPRPVGNATNAAENASFSVTKSRAKPLGKLANLRKWKGADEVAKIHATKTAAEMRAYWHHSRQLYQTQTQDLHDSDEQRSQACVGGEDNPTRTSGISLLKAATNSICQAGQQVRSGMSRKQDTLSTSFAAAKAKSDLERMLEDTCGRVSDEMREVMDRMFEHMGICASAKDIIFAMDAIRDMFTSVKSNCLSDIQTHLDRIKVIFGAGNSPQKADPDKAAREQEHQRKMLEALQLLQAEVSYDMRLSRLLPMSTPAATSSADWGGHQVPVTTLSNEVHDLMFMSGQGPSAPPKRKQVTIQEPGPPQSRKSVMHQGDMQTRQSIVYQRFPSNAMHRATLRKSLKGGVNSFVAGLVASRGANAMSPSENDDEESGDEESHDALLTNYVARRSLASPPPSLRKSLMPPRNSMLQQAIAQCYGGNCNNKPLARASVQVRRDVHEVCDDLALVLSGQTSHTYKVEALSAHSEQASEHASESEESDEGRPVAMEEQELLNLLEPHETRKESDEGRPVAMEEQELLNLLEPHETRKESDEGRPVAMEEQELLNLLEPHETRKVDLEPWEPRGVVEAHEAHEALTGSHSITTKINHAELSTLEAQQENAGWQARIALCEWTSKINAETLETGSQSARETSKKHVVMAKTPEPDRVLDFNAWHWAESPLERYAENAFLSRRHLFQRPLTSWEARAVPKSEDSSPSGYLKLPQKSKYWAPKKTCTWITSPREPELLPIKFRY
eukprot:TRINITY_DN8228_c0_g2_i1.p1 TRINITY_DN8228_c0_g2~~TRINITY_DN8228_c0_g2_i1.p1  ORF type:complete len:797 (-),score=126.66 TRINITY_DN8228_c0_g2_i1:108-2498(-)